MPTLFYFNADFDHELGGHALSHVQRAVDEMSVLFAPLARKDDQIRLSIRVDSEYWNYLSSLGLTIPEVVMSGTRSDGFNGEPWGWSAGADQVFRESGATCFHPPLDIVKYCNSRQCCSEFAQIANTGVPGSTFCTTPDDASKTISCLKEHFPLIIKPAFGGSGFGFAKLEQCDPSDPIFLKQIAKFCVHGGMVIEPWCKRTADISASCTVLPSGEISSLRFHTCHVNSHGAFFGVSLDDNDPVVLQWRDMIGEKVLEAARFLYKKGYWGPVGFDSFLYLDNNEIERCAPVIEINARHVMSDIAYALRDQCAPGKACYLRLMSSRRCSLPRHYEEWYGMVDNLRFNAVSHTGIAVITPLRTFHEEWHQPLRNVFFIAAKTTGELFDMDDCLQHVLESKI